MAKRTSDGDIVTTVLSASSSSSPNVEEREGDILDGSEQYLVHQCNCQTTGSAGLAAAIFEKYPAANTYRNGKQRIPGTVDVIEGVAEDRNVVNLYGQDKPGRPSMGEFCRKQWFQSALSELGTIIRTHPANQGRRVTVAFPYQIGCGLAGGDWSVYSTLIGYFAEKYKDVLHVVIYRLPHGLGIAENRKVAAAPSSNLDRPPTFRTDI